MINYYRAVLGAVAAQAAERQASPDHGADPGDLGPAGSLSRARARRARPRRRAQLDRVERLPDASHWVHYDEAERVTQLLTDFFAPALPTENR